MVSRVNYVGCVAYSVAVCVCTVVVTPVVAFGAVVPSVRGVRYRVDLVGVLNDAVVVEGVR